MLLSTIEYENLEWKPTGSVHGSHKVYIVKSNCLDNEQKCQLLAN